MTTPDTILLIHGLWMTPRSWERWIERYESRGYTVLAPSWPGLEGDVEALRRDASPLADLSAARILAHYEEIIRGLERPPIIMGHSLDRKSTRLNSSHANISYAVFCLKQKITSR